MYDLQQKPNTLPTILVGTGPIGDLFDVIQRCQAARLVHVSVVPSADRFAAVAREVDYLLFMIGFDVS